MQSLEPRRLLAAAAELLVATPTDAASLSIRFDSSARVGNTLVLTGHRDSQNEHLYGAPAGGTTVDLFTSTTTPGSDPRIGISGLIAYHGQALFFANGDAGDGLYRSDGTLAGTQPVKILRPSANVLPGESFIFYDKVYFFWTNSGQPQQMYTTDGTEAGTAPVWTAPPGAFARDVSPIIDDGFFFTAAGQLWRSNGTDAGTAPIWTLPDPNATISSYTAFGQKLFFILSGFSGPRRLYVANRDGTGAVKVNIPNDNSLFEAFVNFDPTPLGEKVIFHSSHPQSGLARLFITDGTDASTVQLSQGSAGLSNNRLTRALALGDGKTALFVQTSSNGSLNGLWATDGTVAGTTRILQTASLDVDNTDFFVSGGRGYLRPFRDDMGLRLYQTDGTAAGTRPIHYLDPGVALQGRTNVFFQTLDDRVIVQGSRNGRPELWSLDPTVLTGEIGGTSFFDFNRDGTRQASEINITGTAYIDLNGNGQLDLNADATRPITNNVPYLFDGLPAGPTYVLRFKGFGIYENVVVSYPPGGRHEIVLTPGQQRLDADFHSFGFAGVIFGTVFDDLDDDGARDPGEPGVFNQPMYVDLNRNGLPDGNDPTVNTASDGTYGFQNLPAGEHVVRRRDVPGWRQTSPPSRGGQVVTLAENGFAEGTFGIVAAAAGSVTGVVWTDWNQDGVRDAGDSTRANTSVYLDINNDGLRSTSAEPAVVTDALGRFTFTQVIPGGSYVVRVSGSTLVQTAPLPAGSGLSVTVTDGATAFAGHLLVYQPGALPPTGKLGGVVFFDADGDGTQGAGEGGIAGRTVYIDADSTDTLTAVDVVAVTDDSGAFLFPNRLGGAYRLRQIVPAGWRQTFPPVDGAVVLFLPTGGTVTVPRFASQLIPPNPGGPYDVDEGQSLQLSASVDPAVDLSTLDWTWDVNGDGVFGDATGASPTLTWAQLQALGIDDGPATWSSRVLVAQGGFASVTSEPAVLSVRDVAPTLTLDGPADVLIERPYRVTFSASDPGNDPLLGWRIDWGDGTAEDVAPDAPITAVHAYAVGGREYTVTLTARQQDGDFAIARTLRVLTPREFITRLSNDIRALDLNVGNKTALATKLAKADAAFAAGDRAAAAAPLRDLLDQVRAWRGKKLSPAAADHITRAASELLALTAPAATAR